MTAILLGIAILSTIVTLGLIAIIKLLVEISTGIMNIAERTRSINFAITDISVKFDKRQVDWRRR